MMDDVVARFLPQFIASARARIERVRGIVDRRDHDALVAAQREMHALVGEAGLLGLADVMPLARDTEVKVQRMRATRDAADAGALLSALDELGKSVERVAPPTRGDGEP